MRNALSPAARFSLLLLTAAAACHDAAGTAGGGDAAAAGLTPVIAVPATLPIHTQVPLVVVVTDTNGVAVKGATVHWAVGAASGSVAPAASLSDGDGHASAVWTLGTKAGDQTVSAALDSTRTRSWTVHVSPGAAVSVVVSPDSVEVPSLQVLVPIQAAAVDSFGNAVPVTWTSLDPLVVQATFDGRLFSWSNGRTLVVASAGTHADTGVVRVRQVAASVQVSPDSLILGVGWTERFLATVRDAAGHEMYRAPITWTSTDPSVATVAAAGDTGIVTGAGGGRAAVIASAGAAADTGWVTVRPPVRLGHPGAGPTSTCALSDAGTAYCWGAPATSYGNFEPPAPVSAPVPLARVWAGDAHACGLSAAGVAYCWGYGALGQLGNGSTPASQPAATPVSGGLTFTVLATGYRHSCGLDASGAAWCWGSNDHGQLGLGATVTCAGAAECAAVPARVAGGHTFTAIDAFWFRTCAVEAGGDVYCWGEGFGAAPVRTMTGHAFDHVAVGQAHICALSAGAAWCQGDNTYGQLGIGPTGSIGIPAAVAGGLTFTQIDAGLYFTCGITSDQHAWCWGRNGDGELGNPAAGIDQSRVPIAVAGGHLFVRLASGGAHTCAEASDGLWCWGSRANGQLATGTGGSVTSPAKVTSQP